MKDLNEIENAVIIAILLGAHTTDMIVLNRCLETRYSDVCLALLSLEIKGYIEYTNKNMANEYGYFLTEKGWLNID